MIVSPHSPLKFQKIISFPTFHSRYPEIYPGWHNRAFVKTMIPMLPQRASTIIGEWMWNPWKWGDVMPSQHQRPGFNGRRRNEQHLVIDKSNVTPSPTQSAIPASAPNIPTWNFRRLSSSQSDEVASPPEGTNVSELDEPPTETAESINQQNTTNT